MTIINNEDWLNVLENTDYEPIENENNTYQSYRFVDLDIEYNFTGQVYNFTFENAVTASETQEFAFAAGSMFITIQKSVFDLGIPFLAKAKLYGGLGMNTNVSTPMVNQEMLESVFGGASNLEKYHTRN